MVSQVEHDYFASVEWNKKHLIERTEKNCPEHEETMRKEKTNIKPGMVTCLFASGVHANTLLFLQIK